MSRGVDKAQENFGPTSILSAKSIATLPSILNIFLAALFQLKMYSRLSLSRISRDSLKYFEIPDPDILDLQN